MFSEIDVQPPCGVLLLSVPNNPIKISCKLPETEKLTKSQHLQGLQSIENPPFHHRHGRIKHYASNAKLNIKHKTDQKVEPIN